MKEQLRQHPLFQKGRHLAGWLTSGWRRQALTGFFILFSLLVIYRLLDSNWELLTTYPWQIRPDWLLYAMIAFFVDFFLVIWIWHLLVARLAQYDNLYRTVKIYLHANLSRRIPGMVWYIASRAVLYQDVGVSKTQISLLSGLELAFFMISGFVTTLLTVPFWSGIDDILSPTRQLWLFFIMVPVSMMLVHPRILQRVWQFTSRSAPAQALRWRDTVYWLILYILTWLVGGLVLFSVINFFQPAPLSELMMIIGIWSLSGTISLAGFFTISFVGLREVTLTVLLTPIIPMPVTLIIAITIRLMWLTGELITSILSLKL